MNTLAICTSTLPKTCFDTSKNQILTGRWGRSLHRLYTSASSAKPPRASCTKSAKGPRRRHSPLSLLEEAVAVGDGDVVKMEEIGVDMVTVTTVAVVVSSWLLGSSTPIAGGGRWCVGREVTAAAKGRDAASAGRGRAFLIWRAGCICICRSTEKEISGMYVSCQGEKNP